MQIPLVPDDGRECFSTGALLVSSGGGIEDWGELFEKTVRRQPLARRTRASGKLHGAQGEVQAVP